MALSFIALPGDQLHLPVGPPTLLHGSRLEILPLSSECSGSAFVPPSPRLPGDPPLTESASPTPLANARQAGAQAEHQDGCTTTATKLRH